MLVIDSMHPDDWPDARSIYLDGIATGNATFETAAPDWEGWDRNHHRFARLVARDSDSLVGWAALSPISTRAVYAGVAEVSVYVSGSNRGQGVGRLLLTHLTEDAERNGIWTLQAGIFPENTASLALHTAVGFRQVGLREKIGKLHGVWRDVLLLELRSQKVGID